MGSKPENILMDADGHICLTDFGLAKKLDPQDQLSMSFCGTPQYIAPEIISRIPHGKAVDWWSLGILLFELVVGVPPFYSDNINEMFEKILVSPLRFPIPEAVPMSVELRHLLSKVRKHKVIKFSIFIAFES
jgi:serum/glucocorticoid-regulated kinase 2